ncbi:LPXTG cell wall anchor domain-containing protein [Streptomyces sp. GD-15H]|uniref:LPXTG cell wall anchor domain-containing protein n=1 Tax=Streptomyces sp. GD-15H TaxID=3129112 RepID=UPI0032447CF7
MSSALRPLLTATAAGTLLCALWFVPSANATSDTPAGWTPSASTSSQVTERTRVVSSTSSTSPASSGVLDTAGGQVRLADTGSFNSTPYILGGTAFLTLGAGFVVYSVRRERLDF